MRVAPVIAFAFFLPTFMSACVSSSPESEMMWAKEEVQQDEWIICTEVMLDEDVPAYIASMDARGWSLISMETTGGLHGRCTVMMRKPDYLKVNRRKSRFRRDEE